MNIISAFAILLLALSIHEFAHGWSAYKLGDPTAKNEGRLTLNPLAHIDPFGTILLPIMLHIMHAPTFGWAKPVPINPLYFRDYWKGMLYTAAAGPLSNIIQAIGYGLLLRGLFLIGNQVGFIIPSPIQQVMFFGVYINLFLAAFNLIPVPPLDGSKILMGILPERYAIKLQQLEIYGSMLLLVLIYLGWPLISPFIYAFVNLFKAIIFWGIY